MRFAVPIAIMFFLTASPGLAAEIRCTEEAVDHWIAKDEMIEKIKSQGYKIEVFKTTSSNCYEIYGRDKDGYRVEIYFNPVTAEIAKSRVRR